MSLPNPNSHEKTDQQISAEPSPASAKTPPVPSDSSTAKLAPTPRIVSVKGYVPPFPLGDAVPYPFALPILSQQQTAALALISLGSYPRESYKSFEFPPHLKLTNIDILQFEFYANAIHVIIDYQKTQKEKNKDYQAFCQFFESNKDKNTDKLPSYKNIINKLSVVLAIMHEMKIFELKMLDIKDNEILFKKLSKCIKFDTLELYEVLYKYFDDNFLKLNPPKIPLIPEAFSKTSKPARRKAEVSQALLECCKIKRILITENKIQKSCLIRTALTNDAIKAILRKPEQIQQMQKQREQLLEPGLQNPQNQFEPPTPLLKLTPNQNSILLSGKRPPIMDFAHFLLLPPTKIRASNPVSQGLQQQSQYLQQFIPKHWGPGCFTKPPAMLEQTTLPPPAATQEQIINLFDKEYPHR